MSGRVRIINGKGDWGAEPPTGADDHDLQSFANDFVTQGGVLHSDDGDGLVEEQDTPTMGVKVGAGTIYVDNPDWVPNSHAPRYYIVVQDSETLLSISSNASGSTRFDLVCQSVDTVTTPNDDASNVCDLVVVEGEPGEGVPDVPDFHELLATVEVASGAVSITSSDITDERREVEVSIDTTSVLSYTSNSTPTPTGSSKKNELYITALAAGATIGAPSGTPVNGNTLLIRIKDNGTARSLTWNAIYSGIVDTLPSTTIISKVMYMGFIYNSTSSKWEMVGLVQQ